MATPVLTSDATPLKGLNRFAASYSGLLCEAPVREGPEVRTAPVAAGLSGARGAMMAIGIEMACAVIAICIYGATRL